MKALVLISAAVAMYFGPGPDAMAAPHFVTPEMMLRNGLTDAQYEKLWAMGRHPRIDPGTARDLVFKSARYENATNWFAVIGKTNDFARLCMEQDSDIQDLCLVVECEQATNRMLRAEIGYRDAKISHEANLITNEVAALRTDIAESAVLSERYRSMAQELRLFPTLSAAFREAAKTEDDRTRKFEVRVRELLETPEN